MDHMKILRRAFDITRDYRALWIFGLLLALTTAGGNGGANGGGGGNGGNGGGFLPPNVGPAFPYGWPPELPGQIMAFVITIVFVVLLLIIVGAIVRFVSETSLIRMVDDYEGENVRVGFRQGWRLGWSNAAFRMFVLDLLFGLGGFLVFLLALAISAAPFLVWMTESDAARALGTAVGFALLILTVLAAVAAALVLSLLLPFMRRAIVLEGMGVGEAIRAGYGLVRRHLGDSILMGVFLFGLGLAFALVMIPVMIALALVGLMIGGLPGLLVGGIANAITGSEMAWLAGVAVGLPLFLIVVIIPGAFISGLWETYKSSAWTLTYRELKALDTVRPASLSPEPVIE